MTGVRRLPYPGLRAFTREESDLFFGREGCVDAMVDRLAATRFLAVLGPSGGGKSSLVRTGLLDALDLGLHPWAGSRWRIADMHPGGQPKRNLAAALMEAKTGSAPEEVDVDLLTTFLGAGPRSVVEWATRGNLPPNCNLLILVDQFEELFRYGDYAQREEAEAFVALLIESASAASVPIHVVITMRSEYLGACALMPGLAEHINAGLYLTPRMGREECKLAIEGPAGVMGFKVEPALVNRLLNDLAGFAPWESGERADQAERLSRQADQLPLMQHVLNRLWARGVSEAGGSGVELKLADYEELGGLSGALDAHGAEILSALGPARASHVEDVFRALISGTSVELAVRRPSRLGELVEVAGGARGDVVAIVEAFRAPDCSFMRTSVASLAGDDVIVDISHESLIRQWTPLREWLRKEARAGAAWRRLINAEERYAQGEGGLLTGLDLHTLVAWWESANPTPAWAARHGGKFESATAFLEASRRAEAAQADAERLRQVRERQRLRWGIAGLATALGIVTLLSISTLVTRNKLKDSNNALSAKNVSLSQQREAANQARDAANQARDAANKARDDADKAHEMAKQDSERTASVLDHVSNVVYNDNYRFLAGVEEVQARLMQELVPYQSDISREHSGMIGPDRFVRDEYRLGTSLEKLGDARQAIAKYADAYERGRAAIAALGNGPAPPEALAVNFLEDGYRYAWFLADTGEPKKGESVLHGMESLMGRYENQAATVPLLVAYARLEALERRYSDDHANTKEANLHLSKAHELAARAAAMPDASMDALRLLSIYSRELSFRVDGTQQQELRDIACAVSEQMIRKSPMDTRAMLERVDCLKIRADRALANKELDSAAKDFQAAHDILDRALQMVPGQQSLLMAMASVDTEMASLWSRRGNEAKQKELNLEAKKYFVDALKGRTLFQSSTGQVKSLYSSFKDIDFSMDPNKEVTYSKQELEFYRDIVEAVTPAVNAFPKARDFAYVAADASANVGKLLAKDPTQAQEAESYLSRTIESLDRSGFIDDTTHFSEDFVTYCRGYSQRIELYASTRQADRMVADVKKLMAACEPLLSKDKYPFDLYLRWNLVLSSWRAGKVFFELQRYREALPYLEYASHWGHADASKLVARIYREGLGGQLDPRKAQEAEALAQKQTIRVFSIPVNFGNSKAARDFYVLEWPPEYPYQGIDDLAAWWKGLRGATVDPETIDEFHKLAQYAREHHLSFPEWAYYSWHKKDLAATRKKYAAEPTAENFQAVRAAAARVSDALGNLGRQQEASALQKELIDTAEQLVKKSPDAAAYRVAWNTFINEGDRLKADQPAEARRAFTRCVELAELLPLDNAEDVHKRLVGYERLGDLDVADNKASDARAWYAKEVEAARKKYALESNADHLESIRIGTNRLVKQLVKLQRQAEADALQTELAGTVESAVKKHPGSATYRVAFDAFISQGDSLKERDRPGARRAFSRAAELAELLPNDNAADLDKRVLAFERVGDQDAADNKVEEARAWFAKEVQAARREHALESSADNLESIRLAVNRLRKQLVKLKRQAEADAIEKELAGTAESLVKRAPGAPVYRIAWNVLIDLGERLQASDPAAARPVFARTLQLAELLPEDNAADLRKRVVSDEWLGDVEAQAEKSDDARGWYVKEVAATRKKYDLENTADNLDSVRIATKRLGDVLVKLKRPKEAEAFVSQLGDLTERFLKKNMGMPANRAACDVFISQGDVLKTIDSAAARRAFTRASELAALLPEDNAADVHRRLVSDERLGDLFAADNQSEDARGWYAREVVATRKKFALESTAENLESCRIAVNRLNKQLAKLDRQREGDALQKELAGDAETLVKTAPGAPVYRVAASILTDQGDHLQARDPQAARQAFERSLQLAELLPEDNTADLRKRVAADEWLGYLDSQAGKIEQARGWYAKQFDAARKLYGIEDNPDDLDLLRIAAKRLSEELGKLKRHGEVQTIQKEVTDTAEKLVKKNPGAATYRVACDVFVSQGDLLKTSDRAAARRAFSRAMELADLLPTDNATDLDKRVLCYERLGDQDAADNKTEEARAWYTKEVETAQKEFALESTAENLESVRLAVNRAGKQLAKLNRQPEAGALQKALVGATDSLLQKSPSPAAYRIAWNVLTDEGELLQTSDPPAARQAFVRSLELAERLPDDNPGDLRKRLVSYEWVGYLDGKAGKTEESRGWYAKEVEAARKRFGLEPTADNLDSVRIAVKRLCDQLVTLKRQSEANVLENELADVTEQFIKKNPGVPAYRVGVSEFLAQGDVLQSSDRGAARRAFARAAELAERLPDDNAGDLDKRMLSAKRLGDEDEEDHKIEDARSWYAKEVDAARKEFVLEPTSENLKWLRHAANRLSSEMVKLKQQPQADALWKGLLDNGETLLAHTDSDQALAEVIETHNGYTDALAAAGDLAGARQHILRARALAQKLTDKTPEGAYRKYQAFASIADSLRKSGAPAEARATYLQASLSQEHYLGFQRKAEADQNSLAASYGNLSFMYLQGGNFPKSIEAAQRGLKMEPETAWIEQNMAHGLLLSGNRDEAVKHYLRVRKAMVFGRTMVAATQDDFEILKSLGFENPAMGDILKQMAED